MNIELGTYCVNSKALEDVVNGIVKKNSNFKLKNNACFKVIDNECIFEIDVFVKTNIDIEKAYEELKYAICKTINEMFSINISKVNLNIIGYMKSNLDN